MRSPGARGASARSVRVEIMRAPDRRDLPLAFENASLRIGAVEIVRDLASTSVAGAPTMLLGPNGSGKSTLMRLAMGLVRADSRAASPGADAATPGERLAMVFQRPVMLRRTAAANVAYALPRARRRARVTRVAARRSASRVSPTARRGSSPAASSSGSRSPARSRAIRKSCFSTSRPRASIPPPPRRSRTSCARSRRRASRS